MSIYQPVQPTATTTIDVSDYASMDIASQMAMRKKLRELMTQQEKSLDDQRMADAMKALKRVSDQALHRATVSASKTAVHNSKLAAAKAAIPDTKEQKRADAAKKREANRKKAGK